MKTSMSQEEKFMMMTTAPLPGLISKLAGPTIISMLISSIYNMADTFFVAKIGTSATAAVGVVFPVMTIIQALGFFFGHGSGNSMSRRLGAKDTKTAEELAATGFFFALLCGIAVTLTGEIFLDPLAIALGSTRTILPYAREYMRIILLGAPYMTAQFVLNNQLRFQGNAFYAMIGVISGGILNIFLDPLFIFGFNLGVSGAAIATVVSQLISFVLLLIGLRVSKCIPIRIRNVKNLRQNLMMIAGGGLPSLFRQGLGSVGTLALNLAANPFGDAAIAAMSIVGRIMFFAASALIGFGQGFQREAFWFCVKISSVVLLVLAAAGYLSAETLITVFRKNDPEVIAIGTRALRFQCMTLPLNGWIIMNNMLTQTIGKTVRASLLAASRQGLFFIPAILILPMVFGIGGIEAAQPVADFLSFALAMVLNRKTMKELKGI